MKPGRLYFAAIAILAAFPVQPLGAETGGLRQALIDSRRDHGDAEWIACAYDAIHTDMGEEAAHSFARSYIDPAQDYVISADPMTEALSIVEVGLTLSRHCEHLNPLSDWAPLG